MRLAYTRNMNSRRSCRARTNGLPLICNALLITLASCTETSTPEAQIIAMIEAAEEAAEARELKSLKRLISDNYSDTRNNTKTSMENILRLLFVTHQSIHLLVRVEEIVLTNPNRASLSALVGMADTAKGLPSVDLYQFELLLVRDRNDDWQVLSADWRRGLGRPVAKD